MTKQKENVSSEKDVKELKSKKDSKLTKLEKELAEFKKQNEQLIALLSKNNLIPSNGGITITSDDIIYSIKTLMLNETELISPDGNVRIKLMSQHIIDISQRDLRELFKKNGNRELFAIGVCQFADNEDCKTSKEEAYKKFRIKPKFNFEEQAILDILETQNEQQIYKKFNDITESKLNLTASHTLFNIIMGLDLDGKLSKLPRVTYDIIEKYFECSFAQGTMNLQTFRTLKG